MWLGTALGHGTFITVLGVLAVLVGVFLPVWLDGVMERAVGITLLILGGLAAAFSLTVGPIFLLGRGGMLPAIYGG